jgi:hypothetical protein
MENGTESDKRHALHHAYAVKGFRTQAKVESYDGKPSRYVVTLIRRQKKRCAAVAARHATNCMIGGGIAPEIFRVETGKFIWTSRCAA